MYNLLKLQKKHKSPLGDFWYINLKQKAHLNCQEYTMNKVLICKIAVSPLKLITFW